MSTTRIPVLVALSDIDVFENYRKDFDGIEELAANIADVGLLQPLVVRPHPTDPGRFLLIAGERRLRALRQLAWTEVPATVRDGDERDAAWAQLLENEARRNPNPLEQAMEYASQIDRHGRTVEEIAEAIGRKANYVRDRLALLDCAPAVQEAVRAGALPQSQALAVRDLDHNRQMIAVRDYGANPAWTAERFANRVSELRLQQGLEAQVSLVDDLLVQEVYEIPGVSLARKVGAVGMARILDRIRAEVALPEGLLALVEKAIDDHLGEKAAARRDAAHRAWQTMREEKAG